MAKKAKAKPRKPANPDARFQAEVINQLEGICRAIERIADHLAPLDLPAGATTDAQDARDDDAEGKADAEL